MNPYGRFDDENKEYVILRPDTPLPWINYLGSEDFFGIISNTAGGYCFYRDARLRRVTRYRYNNIPVDNNGRYIYIKDGKTVWSPSWKPLRIDPDRYECRHGLGYTVIKSVKDDLEVTVKYFIPNGWTLEIWDVQVRNLSPKTKSVRLWGFVEWCLWDAFDDMTNFQRNFSTGQVEIANQVIFHVTEYRERRDHYAYFATSHPTTGFDTSRDAFVGLYNGLEMPQVVAAGECRGSIAHGWSPVGVHQIDLEIEAGGEKRFNFLLGYARNGPDKKFTAPKVANKEPFYDVFKHFSKNDAVDDAFDDLKKYWQRLLSTYQAEIKDPIVRRMVNTWNQYQCMVTFNMSRSASFYESGIGRGMGYRDSNQDLLGFVHIVPERARQRILELAATQMSDGSCFHQYQPLTKKGNENVGSGFNDDPLWLNLSVSAYLKETGDFAILDQVIGYADVENSRATLMDHLEISLDYTLRRRGPHGLPLIGHADWNDCLNLNCFSKEPGESFQTAGDIEGSVAESVMIAGLFCAACNEMVQMYQALGRKEKADKVRSDAENMRKTVYEHGWDGEIGRAHV